MKTTRIKPATVFSTSTDKFSVVHISFSYFCLPTACSLEMSGNSR